MLRDYQREAVEAVLDDLPHHRSLGLIAPTGAGKTIIMQEIAERWLKVKGFGFNVIIVSHLSILQEQTFDRFIRTSKFKTGRLQAESKPQCTSRIIITTMQTLRKERSHIFIKRRLLHHQTTLIMIDEAQMYGAQSYLDIHAEFPTAKIIGFSASPYRGNRYSFNQFDKVSYSVSLQTLIDGGYLVPPHLLTVDLKGMTIADRIAHVAKIYERDLNGKGALAYWSTKHDAEKAAHSFLLAGIKAAAITDDTPLERKRQVLEDFEAGKISVIHNVNILSAGYDSTKVYGIFLPMGTSSPVNYIQRIGRGLRPETGKKKCRVYLYGDAPSIKRGLYTRMQAKALKATADPDYGEKGDLYELLDRLEAKENQASDKIKITREIIETCDKIKGLGMENLHRLIRFKKFPNRYLRTLITSEARADEKIKGEASEQQRTYLVERGFEAESVTSLTRKEASCLIGMIQSSLNQEFMVQAGLYENKHISEVPMAYFGALKKKKQFNHPVFKLYKAWKERGKPI